MPLSTQIINRNNSANSQKRTQENQQGPTHPQHPKPTKNIEYRRCPHKTQNTEDAPIKHPKYRRRKKKNPKIQINKKDPIKHPNLPQKHPNPTSPKTLNPKYRGNNKQTGNEK
jgi:hypothetical protein